MGGDSSSISCCWGGEGCDEAELKRSSTGGGGERRRETERGTESVWMKPTFLPNLSPAFQHVRRAALPSLQI